MKQLMRVSLFTFRECFRTELAGKFSVFPKIRIGISRVDADVKLLENSGSFMLEPVVIHKGVPALT